MCIDCGETLKKPTCFIYLTALYPLILTSLCLCTLACILGSLHAGIFRFICSCFHLCILISLHPHILISSDSCVLAYILASSHRHVLRFLYACWYPLILTCSYPQVCVCLLVSSHPQVNLFSIQMNNCILASSSSLVLGSHQFK